MILIINVILIDVSDKVVEMSPNFFFFFFIIIGITILENSWEKFDICLNWY